MWEKAKDFLKKAFTIIFLASIVIWFAQKFSFDLQMVENSADSILAKIGSFIAPIFAPLGFNNWRASTALITGFTAKESVVSTLSILTGAGTDAQLSLALSSIFTPLSSLSFLAFTILYMPCVAAFAAAKRELGSMRRALAGAAYQTAAAYIAALLIFQIGRLIIYGTFSFATVLAFLFLAAILYALFRKDPYRELKSYSKRSVEAASA